MFKKRKKTVKTGGLSFGDDEEDGDEPKPATPAQDGTAPTDADESSDAPIVKKRLKPNSAVPNAPKALTKANLQREAQLKEQLRKEYLQLQEAVKATEFVIPFTFFDGKSSPGGTCRMKKGDHIWLFLERARKLGADMAGRGDRSKRDWARISVDDLMVVRGDLTIPHVRRQLLKVICIDGHANVHYSITTSTTSSSTLLSATTMYPSSPTPPNRPLRHRPIYCRQNRLLI
jgi:protein FAM50